jgi:Zn finger protein HypA/HybF involved in hydrogenase expression
MRKLTTNEFIERARKIHGNKYNYSKVNYIHTKHPIIIICPLHGQFFQLPNKHLCEHGCSICGKLTQISKLTKTTQQFVQDALRVHGDKYIYNNINYIGSNILINITCPIHGQFDQTPHDHLSGKGCPKCGLIKVKISLRKPVADFIKFAKQIHKNKYNYSKINYINDETKIEIICPYHGSFWQKPNNHLNGNGCPRCFYRISKAETDFLNILNIPNTKDNRQVLLFNQQVDRLKDKTVYEFLGDYWHGNPLKFPSNELNQKVKQTFGLLYSKTIKKFQKLKDNGYVIKYIWESDWKLWNKNKSMPLPMKEY